jgi:DNA modification methylase
MKPRKETLADGIELWLGDCRDVLPTLGKVDAVVTDPPYGIDEVVKASKGSRTPKPGRNRLGSSTPIVKWQASDWDNCTADEGVALARELAQWAIIFGGNFYNLPPTSCWLVWDKLNSGDFADCELAWTNLPKAVRRIRYLWNGMIKAPGEVRGDHPTQKPLGVMRWCIGHLPDDAQTILDPFMGSGTTGVACVQLGRKFIGIELDPGYFDIACRRIGDELKRPRLDLGEPIAKPVQEALI